MFKKFKDKLAEEMKQSPARLQASMQQLAQAVVSPALSNTSVQELSVSNDNFSLTEEGDETPKNSPIKHGFQNVDLVSPISNSLGMSRRSSISSITSDTSSLFPIYESPANLYHLQSDMDQSASEIDENINSQLDKVTKDQIYSAYRKIQAKYHKYRGRYTDLATHYKELERVNSKLESVLVETQDKVLRRIVDLKEQCQLEQQAKAHLEEALRNDIEEKDHIINTLNTKIKLLQASGPNLETTLSDTTNDQKENLKDNLIDLSTSSSISNENTLLVENSQLKDKLKKLENIVLKYKESLKRNKEKFTEILTEKITLEFEYETLKNSYAEKEKEINCTQKEIKNLTDQMTILKKREEESVISLAENKLSIHRELEDKEEQIKKLQLDLKHMTESKENLSEVVNKYKVELEKLKLSHSSKNSDSEKKEVIQDYLKSKLDEKENEFQEIKIKLEELQKLTKEYQTDKEKLYMEFSNYKLKCAEIQNEYDAQKIVAEEKTKEAEATIEKLQATVQSLDKELENMRNALIDRDKVCENYNAKVHEYATMLEKMKEKLLIQETEMKTYKEKIQDSESTISELKTKLKADNFNIGLLHKEKNNLVKNISNYKLLAKKLKEDNTYIRNNTVKYFTDINNEIFILKDGFDTFLEINNIIPNHANFQIKVKEFEELKQKYDQLQTELKDTVRFKSSLEVNLEKYNKQLHEMSMKLEQQCEIDVKNRKLIAEIDNLNFKLYDLRNLPEQMKLLTTESKSLQEEFNNVNNMNHLLSNEICDLKVQLEEAHSNTIK
ncbi:Golgin subfamily A member 4, partial [Eufriesea mexicana]